MQDLRILVVDDDAGDRKLVKRLIARAGVAAKVVEAMTADDALDLADPDLDAVFLDHLLPGVTGLSLLRDIRYRCPRAAILMMSGQGNETLAKSAIQLGATDYLSKSGIDEVAMKRMLVNSVHAATRQFEIDEQRRDLSTFVEVLVHDFKAPIRAVHFLAGQVQEDLASGDAEAVQEGLELLTRSTRQMMRTIKSLADHIKYDQKQDFAFNSVRTIVKDTLAGLTSDLHDAGAEVSLEFDEGVPEAWCDGAQIGQVVQNLVANSIKYSGAEPPRIRIGCSRDPGGWIAVSVADRGLGIPAKYRSRIFEPFKRLPGRDNVEGTGLGLATCRKFVARNGGRIWCESEEGDGTTMIFTLPVTGTPEEF
ncbi:response regulator [Rhodobacterales bacterium HKCCE2091]|nr:response regulator [Rhodobacterales bacterium HKCCE2091]